MKKPKHGDPYKELLKAVKSQPLQIQAQQKKKKRTKRESNQKQSSLTDSIYEELEQPGFGYAEARRLLSDLILEPLPKLASTKALPGYNDARISAENAMRRIWEGTEAARAGREGDPWLGVGLFLVRVGLIDIHSSGFLRLMLHAQKIGKAQWFIERLTDELKNARKRVPGAAQFSRFRALLVRTWMHYGFWLMSDNLIARLTHVSRPAVAKAVKELALVKHRDSVGRPIVKSLDKDGRFVFREGYPLKT